MCIIKREAGIKNDLTITLIGRIRNARLRLMRTVPFDKSEGKYDILSNGHRREQMEELLKTRGMTLQDLDLPDDEWHKAIEKARQYYWRLIVSEARERNLFHPSDPRWHKRIDPHPYHYFQGSIYGTLLRSNSYTPHNDTRDCVFCGEASGNNGLHILLCNSLPEDPKTTLHR